MRRRDRAAAAQHQMPAAGHWVSIAMFHIVYCLGWLAGAGCSAPSSSQGRCTCFVAAVVSKLPRRAWICAALNLARDSRQALFGGLRSWTEPPAVQCGRPKRRRGLRAIGGSRFLRAGRRRCPRSSVRWLRRGGFPWGRLCCPVLRRLGRCRCPCSGSGDGGRRAWRLCARSTVTALSVRGVASKSRGA